MSTESALSAGSSLHGHQLLDEEGQQKEEQRQEEEEPVRRGQAFGEQSPEQDQ